MINTFSWRGEPILDIEAWANQRNESMVDVVWLVKQINPYARKSTDMILWTEETQTMPESFFTSLRYPDSRRIKSCTKRLPHIQDSSREINN